MEVLRIFRMKKEYQVFFFSFLISLIFSVIYSEISLIRFFEYKLTALDLGVNGALLYQVFHGGIPFTIQGIKKIAYNKLIYLLIAPFYNIYPKMWIILIFQDTLLAFTALPLSLIAWKKTRSILISIFIAIMWNMYFPVEGVFWFDFHFMALFPFFFIMGVMFQEYGKKRLSIVFLILSAITDYLSPFIVFAYIFITYIQGRKNESDDTKYHKRVLLYFSAILIFIFVAVNIATSFNYTYVFTSNFFPATSAGVRYGIDKIEFIVWIFIPFLFLPFIAPLELLVALPGILLAIFNNYPGFYQQGFQYPSLYAPGIFLAFISSISILSKHFPHIKIARLRISIKKTSFIRFIAVISLIIIMITGISIGPYAAFQKNPLMSEIQNIYPIYKGNQYSFSPVNQKYINYLNDEISLVPRDQSVLIQNNMPCLIQGYESTLPGLMSKGFIPQYIMAYPYTSWFDRVILPSMGQNATPLYTIDSLLSHNRYGIVEEKAGITLYELNVKSTNSFIPYDQNLSFSSFPGKTGVMSSNGEIFSSIHENGTLIYGPYYSMPPGKFELTFHFSNLIISNGSKLILQAFTVSNYLHAYQCIGNGIFNVSGTHNFLNLSVTLDSHYYFNNIQYDLFGENLTGLFILQSVNLLQTGD